MTTRPRPQEAPSGMTVGEYTLLHRLGEGGMGVVHLARAADGRRVALKVLRPHVVGGEEARDRLAREVNSLSRVRSPRVAEIIDADPWGPVPFVATRYVPGLSLHDHVPEEGPLRGDDLVHFARSLAEALQAVHRVGVLHRDIKPSNVLMEGRSPVLIDFGLARVADDDRITRTGWLLGTPGYLAPEVLHGDEPTTAADVHAWAATVAFAGTGQPPFGRGPSVAVMDRVRRGEHDLADLGSEVRALVETALDPDPAARPSLPRVIEALGGTPTHERVFPSEQPTTAFTEDHRTFAFDVPTRVEAPAGTPGPPEPAYTRAAPPPHVEPSHQPYQSPPPAPIARPVRAIERVRRFTLGLGLLGVVVAATTAAPYLTAGGLVVVVALLRWCSVIGSSAAARRHLRGRKWYDAPMTAFSTPIDLLASLPGTVLLLLCAGFLCGCAALASFAFGVQPEQGLPGVGLVLGLALWLGPGGKRVRSAVGRVGVPVARVPWVWVVALVCLGAAAGVAGFIAYNAGINWAPDSGEPWRGGTWLARFV